VIGADGTLSVRSSNVGGPVKTSVTEYPDGWTDNSTSITLLIHGFNNNQKEAEDAYKKFLARLGCWPLNKIGCFYWPGDAEFSFLQILDFLSYPTEIPDAKASAQSLANHLQVISENSGNGVEFNLIGHSMGCRLILELLGVLPDNVKINLIMLMAAAVPVELLAPGEKLEKISKKLNNRIVLYSESDLVLQYAFPAGQALATTMGTDGGPYFEAVGRHGNPSEFPSKEPISRNGNDHGDYWDDKIAVTELSTQLGIAHKRLLTSRSLCEFKEINPSETPFREFCLRNTETRTMRC